MKTLREGKEGRCNIIVGGDEGGQELDPSDGWAVLHGKYGSVHFKRVSVMIPELYHSHIVMKNKSICSVVSGSQSDHMFPVTAHQHIEDGGLVLRGSEKGHFHGLDRES